MDTNNIIYIDSLIKYTEGLYKGKIDWSNNIGEHLKVLYNNEEYSFIIKDYIKGKNKIILELNGKILKPIFTGHLLKCKIGGIVGIKSDEFKYKIGETIKDDRRNLTIIDREYRYKDKQSGYTEKQKWYKYHCNICDWDEGWIEESPFKKGNGCSCCNNKTVVEGINDIPTTNPEMVQYFVGGYEEAKLYTCNSSQNIFPICPDCGRIKDKKMKINTIFRQGIGCSCSDGIRYPNKLAFKMLEELEINFISEYSPKWCKYLYKNKYRQGSYDFYFKLNNKGYILEMDGGFHTRDNNMSGQTSKESKYIDNEKDRLAREHGIEVIRIDCCYNNSKDRFEYIKKNILSNNRLNELFNLSDINWNKCEEFALSNLVKIACELKRNNSDLTTSDIGKIMGYNSTTIINWLKQGNGIWCNYDSKEEMRNGSFKAGKSNAKQVEMFKDGTSQGIFESATEIERVSEKLFGIKLFQGYISAVCTGKKESYKGYTFKY